MNIILSFVIMMVYGAVCYLVYQHLKKKKYAFIEDNFGYKPEDEDYMAASIMWPAVPFVLFGYAGWRLMKFFSKEENNE